MRYSEYKFKFYINASHAIIIGGVQGENHSHTWEIMLDTIKIRNDFVAFDVIEKQAEAFLAPFQDNDFSEIKPFDTINPTLENITEFFMEEMKKILEKSGWLLSKIEVSETPSRSFVIDLSDEADEIKSSLSGADKQSVKEKANEKFAELFGKKEV